MITPYEQCTKCWKIVKVNKPLLGSLHLCVPTEPDNDIGPLMAAQQRAIRDPYTKELFKRINEAGAAAALTKRGDAE